MKPINAIIEVIKATTPRYSKLYTPASLDMVKDLERLVRPFAVITNPTTALIENEFDVSNPMTITTDTERRLVYQDTIIIDFFDDVVVDIISVDQLCKKRAESRVLLQQAQQDATTARTDAKVYWSATDNASQLFLPLLSKLTQAPYDLKIRPGSNVRTSVSPEGLLQNSIELVIDRFYCYQEQDLTNDYPITKFEVLVREECEPQPASIKIIGD